jgi:amino acid adenylation domain-containing protein
MIESEAAASPPSALPLSPYQRRFFFLSQLLAESGAYNVVTARRVKGALDRGALDDALRDVVERHDVLRTRYLLREGEPYQIAGDASVARFDEVAPRAGADPAVAARELVRAEQLAGFDVLAEPPLRAKIVRLAADEHLVLISVHHVAFDGASMGLFWSDLIAAYGARASGNGAPPAAPVAQYADYVRTFEAAHDAPEHLAYWRDRLRGAAPLLAFPTDLPRRAEPSYAAVTDAFALSDATSEALRACARAEGCTPFMAFVAGLALLLEAYTHEDDVLIGSVVSLRPPRFAKTLGCFVDTLPLRIGTGAPTFRALLRGVRDVVTGAFEHRFVPYDRIVSEIAPERTTSHNALCQVFVNAFQPAADVRAAGLEWARVDIAMPHVKGDLFATVTAERGAVRGKLECDAALFVPATVRRLCRNLETVLDGCARDPDGDLRAIPTISAAERRLIASWSGSETGAAHPDVVAAIGEAGRARAAQPAVISDSATLSHAELAQRSDAVAARLRAAGVEPGRVVTVVAERSATKIAVLLGIWKHGCAYLALEPREPAARVAYMLRDSAADALVTDAATVAEDGIPRFALDAIAAPLEGARAEVALSARTPAYVIYTSGSTGMPKAVLVDHGALRAFVAAARSVVGIIPGERWSWSHSLAFDFSVFEIWCALAGGATVVVVPYWTSRDPAAMWELIAARRVAVLNQTPSALRLLLSVTTPRSPNGRSGLRYILLGGERCDEEIVAAWRARFGADDVVMWNVYGPTETTVGAVVKEIRGDTAPTPRGAFAIGRPLPGYGVRVLDRRRRSVPVGATGELYVLGPAVSRGYLNAPEATGARFDVLDEARARGVRSYRTGDLVRFLPDGDLEFVGREDDQVKVRGFRIELEEIRRRIEAHPNVARCAVRTAGAGGERTIAAYVVTREDVPAAELRAFVRAALPSYMVPASFTRVDAIPLGPSGKIDFAALPAPERGGAPEPAYAPAASALERTLCEAWAAALRIERVGVHDNFLELGGDSLRIVIACAEAARRGVQVTVQDVYRDQTVAELAHRLEREDRRTAAPAYAPFALVRPDERALAEPAEDAYPATRLQLGMLFESQRAPAGAGTYHVVQGRVVGARLELEALREALLGATCRHRAMRTVLDLVRFERPMQIVRPAAPVALDAGDLRGDADAEAAIERWARDQIARGTRLDALPAFRFGAFRTADESFTLLVHVHHALVDGQSFEVLFDEVLRGYTERLAGVASAPQPPDAAFAEHVMLELMLLEDPRTHAFWQRYLEGARVAAAAAAPQRVRAATVLDHRLVAALRELARTGGVALRDLFLAVHFDVLARTEGSAEVVTGLTTHGRPESNGADSIGAFANVVPLRAPASATTSWFGLALAVADAVRSVYPYRRTPFSALKRMLGAELPTAFNYTAFSNEARYAAGAASLVARRDDVHAFAMLERPFVFRANVPPDGSPAFVSVSTTLPGVDPGSRAARYVARLEALADDPYGPRAGG